MTLQATEIDSLAPSYTASNQTVLQKGSASFHFSNGAHFLDSSPTEDIMVFIRTNNRSIESSFSRLASSAFTGTTLFQAIVSSTSLAPDAKLPPSSSSFTLLEQAYLLLESPDEVLSPQSDS